MENRFVCGKGKNMLEDLSQEEETRGFGRKKSKKSTGRQNLTRSHLRKCDFCRGRFRDLKGLKKHTRKNHGFPCQLCTKLIQTSKEAYVHWRTTHVTSLQIQEGNKTGHSPRYLTTKDGSEEFKAMDLEKWETQSPKAGDPRSHRLSSEELSSVLVSPLKESKRNKLKEINEPRGLDLSNCSFKEIVKGQVQISCDLPEDLITCEPSKFLDSDAPLAPYLTEISQKTLTGFFKYVK